MRYAFNADDHVLSEKERLLDLRIGRPHIHTSLLSKGALVELGGYFDFLTIDPNAVMAVRDILAELQTRVVASGDIKDLPALWQAVAHAMAHEYLYGESSEDGDRPLQALRGAHLAQSIERQLRPAWLTA